ncbi:DUF6526 family protein [Paenibacillus sp. GCM10023252]|uniref:DUF6526 family protein n=1 Tax=Paenibacillus sp. GCM10023252 TaxID=3252649 RepID=UPI003607A93C
MGEGTKPGRNLRFDWPYHFAAMPLLVAVLIGSIVNVIGAIRDDEQTGMDWLLVVLGVCLLFAVTRIRVYATKTQDRIIRMEEQFRYYRLTGKELDSRLTINQIIALRNAGDKEFPALCDRAAASGMKPADIREAIKDWRPDTMRI